MYHPRGFIFPVYRFQNHKELSYEIWHQCYLLYKYVHHNIHIYIPECLVPFVHFGCFYVENKRHGGFRAADAMIMHCSTK